MFTPTATRKNLAPRSVSAQTNASVLCFSFSLDRIRNMIDANYSMANGVTKLSLFKAILIQTIVVSSGSLEQFWKIVALDCASFLKPQRVRCDG